MKTQIFKVEQFRFNKGKTRIVSVSKELVQKSHLTEVLDLVFKYGQNEFQPQIDSPSVSVGDVIRIDNIQGKSGNYMVAKIGFSEVPEHIYKVMKKCAENEFKTKEHLSQRYDVLMHKELGDEAFNWI